MEHPSPYLPRFIEIIKENNLTLHELPAELQELIEKFQVAGSILATSNVQDKKKYLEILAKTDAVISAKVFSLKNSNSNNQGKVEVNKLKLLSLKAKALKARMKLTS